MVRKFINACVNSNALLASWQDLNNRRIFFEEYAQLNDFDPLNPNNWYLVPEANLIATKVLGATLILHVARVM